MVSKVDYATAVRTITNIMGLGVLQLRTRINSAHAKPFHEIASATEQEAKHQMVRWTKISIAMLGLTGAYGAIQVLTHLDDHDPHRINHPHGDESTTPPRYGYLKLRNKPFPWHYSNCDLLDFHCKQLARAAEQALKQQQQQTKKK